MRRLQMKTKTKTKKLIGDQSPMHTTYNPPAKVRLATRDLRMSRCRVVAYIYSILEKKNKVHEYMRRLLHLIAKERRPSAFVVGARVSRSLSEQYLPPPTKPITTVNSKMNPQNMT